MDDVTRDVRDDPMPYGVNTLRLRISLPPAPEPQGYDDGTRPLRGWTGGVRHAANTPPGTMTDAGGDGGAGDVPSPDNPNARVDALWAKRAEVKAEMDRLEAGSDHGTDAANRYQRRENELLIINADLNATRNASLSGTGYNEPGDLLGYLRALAAQAPGAPPDSFGRMSPEEQYRYIKDNAPDYFNAHTDETTRIYGETVGGPIGRAFSELGIAAPGVVEGLVGAVRARVPRNGAGVETARNQPGVVSQSTPLPPIAGPWLRGTQGNAGLVPGQVAEKLQGRTFVDFGEFRSAFWQAVSDVPELAAQFSKPNLALMKQGKAPIAPASQQQGMQRSYILHHRNPIASGGAVYDMSNIVVVNPKAHQSILDPRFHFGEESR